MTVSIAKRTDQEGYRTYIKTYGCQMNDYDSFRLIDGLKSQLTITTTDRYDDATLLIMNTCSVRQKAVQKMYSELGIWRKYKQAHPDTIIAVGGCVASQEGEQVFRRAPFVDIVFGPQSLHLLPALVRSARQKQSRQLALAFLAEEKFDQLPPHTIESTDVKTPHGFVSIMEGCGKHCSYCIVPLTRGGEYYRPVESIITEIDALADQGATEITLLGQNVNAWRGEWHGRAVDFAWLLHLLDAHPALTQIRFTTSHPLEMSERLIDCFGTLGSLAPELHLPVQSGSDAVLRSMKRGYRVRDYTKIINAVRERLPTISVTTDFIVGYPGETEADFQATLDLATSISFDRAYCFIYSQRPATKAARLVDNTPLAAIKKRMAKLQNLYRNRNSSSAPPVIPIYPS